MEVRMSTMCGACGNNTMIAADGRHFIAHLGRNGQPCPGDRDYPAEREQAMLDLPSMARSFSVTEEAGGWCAPSVDARGWPEPKDVE